MAQLCPRVPKQGDRCFADLFACPFETLVASKNMWNNMSCSTEVSL